MDQRHPVSDEMNSWCEDGFQYSWVKDRGGMIERIGMVREVHGVGSGFRHDFRCRIEHRKKRGFFGITRPRDQWRYVLERRFVVWRDFQFGPWKESRDEVVSDAHALLDVIESSRAVEYVYVRRSETP